MKLPSFLPHGRRFIYLRVYRQAPERSGLYVGDLTSESSTGDRFLMATGFNASYVVAADAGPGVLLCLRDRALYGQRFDDSTTELLGKAVKLADHELTWLDREGRPVGRVGSPEQVGGLAVSPDGALALVARHTPHNVERFLYMLSGSSEGGVYEQTFFWPAATLLQQER